MLPLPDAKPLPISIAERRRLLQVARKAIVSAVSAGRVPDLYNAPGEVVRRCGVFVTIRTGRVLRGCIGKPESPFPLEQTVARCAALSARDDPRFPALRAEEIPGIEIEISILSAPVPITSEQIEPGVHGLAVSAGEFRGLLLPQVAREFGWNRERFLAETCRKAGLGPEAWRDPQTKIEGFTAEVFSESDFPSGGAASDR